MMLSNAIDPVTTMLKCLPPSVLITVMISQGDGGTYRR